MRGGDSGGSLVEGNGKMCKLLNITREKVSLDALYDLLSN